MITDSTHRLVSVRDALTLIGTGRTCFYSKLNSGEIRALKVGRRTFVQLSEIEAYISRLPIYLSPHREKP